MTMDKRTYVLSQAAEEDLEQVFDYTEKEFGLEQTVQYLSGIEQMCSQLLTNPMLGRERREIRDGLRSIPCQSHVIFYRILANQIRVVRVLHGSRTSGDVCCCCWIRCNESICDDDQEQQRGCLPPRPCCVASG